MQSLGFEAKNQTIYQMIADIDQDNNGSIDFDEFLDMMTAKMVSCQMRVHTLLHLSISLHYLPRLDTHQSDKDTREDIQKVFNLFDDDQSGKISLRNLKRVAKELGETMSGKFPTKDVEQLSIRMKRLIMQANAYTLRVTVDAELLEMIERADTDADGEISPDEFYAIMTKK
jgi:Ca2+-binding EF-hand superfamily protein